MAMRSERALGMTLDEKLNVWSHAPGIGLGLLAALVLGRIGFESHDPWVLGSFLAYVFGMGLSYVVSTLYHACLEPGRKSILRKWDHAAIYLHIAGTYTPFTLLVLRERGFWGWGLFLFVWLAAVAGVLLTFRRMRKVDHLKTVCYLMMGWAVIVAIKPLLAAFQASGRMESFYWLMGGGLCYTFGTIFFFLDNGRKYMHFFWHLFVLGGSACHFWAIYLLIG